MALSRTMYQDSSLLTLPENAISSAVTPVQTWFSGIVQSISDYFYVVRLRSNWEAEYNRVAAENMELASVVARNAELEKQLSQFTNMQEEIVTNANMNPLTAQVIAREQGTYFSVFTVNKGSRDGVDRTWRSQFPVHSSVSPKPCTTRPAPSARLSTPTLRLPA